MIENTYYTFIIKFTKEGTDHIQMKGMDTSNRNQIEGTISIPSYKSKIIFKGQTYTCELDLTEKEFIGRKINLTQRELNISSFSGTWMNTTDSVVLNFTKTDKIITIKGSDLEGMIAMDSYQYTINWKGQSYKGNFDPITKEFKDDLNLKRVNWKDILTAYNKGANGHVFRYLNGHTPKVLKVYTSKNVRNKAIPKMNSLFNNTKNARYKIKSIELSSSNVPEMNSLTNTVFALDMPYLGISLRHAKDLIQDPQFCNKLKTNIVTLLLQCYQLMQFIKKILIEKERCHADLHLGNILINDSTFVMSFIDFDRMRSFIETYKNVLSGIKKGGIVLSFVPPELFLGIKDDTTMFNRKNSLMSTYITQFELNKSSMLELSKNNKAYLDTECQTKYKKSYNECTDDEKAQIIMPYFDYYGFGLAMSIFFTDLYHNCIKPDRNVDSKYKLALEKTITLLNKMCDIEIEQRPKPDTVCNEMNTILREAGIQSGGRHNKKSIKRRACHPSKKSRKRK
jgi:hypothetical protein